MSVRRRRIKERLERMRKYEAASVDTEAFYAKVQAAIDKWRDKPFDLDRFLFDAFGPLPIVDQPRPTSEAVRHD